MLSFANIVREYAVGQFCSILTRQKLYIGWLRATNNDKIFCLDSVSGEQVVLHIKEMKDVVLENYHQMLPRSLEKAVPFKDITSGRYVSGGLSEQYKKLLARNQKALADAHVLTISRPWDYGYALSHFAAALRFMYEYYASAEQVQYHDEPNYQTKVNTLRSAVKTYDNWQKADQDGNLRKADKLCHKFFRIVANNIQSWWE